MSAGPAGMSADMSESSADVDVDVFERRYLAHAGSQLPGRDDAWLATLAKSHLDFGRVRAAGRTLLRVGDLDADTTSVDIVTTDVPYLVDSLRAELARRRCPAERVLHPQLVVRRDPDGNLRQIYDLDDNAPVPDGAIVESWLHLELEDVPSAQQQGLAYDLSRVLADVHHAVADAPAMYRRIRGLADQLADDPGEFDRETSEEAGELLRWLADGNYMILGHAAYSANELASPRARADDGDAMGVLRGGTARISPLELLPAFRSGAPLVIFKSPLVSTVRRSARYDCVTVTTPAAPGRKQMVHVFLGLLTGVEDGTVGRVPVVRRRIAEILLRSGVRADSHTGRRLLAALRTLPRDELLEAPTGDLLRLAQLVVDRAEHGAVGVFARIHLNRDFVTVLVYFAASRFGPETRRRVRAVITRYWPGEVIGRDDRIVELGLVRMQFLVAVRPGTQPPSPDRPTVEADVARAIRRWSDDLHDLLVARHGLDEATRLFDRYEKALPEAYKEDFDAATAVEDLAVLDPLPDHDGLGFTLYTPAADEDADRRLKVFRTGEAVSLARALPIFTQMGIEVLDERPYEVELSERYEAWIYDFGLRLPAGVDFDARRAEHVVAALELLWRGELEQDGFNALVVRADLTWWQANVLRAYAKYLRQGGTTFSQGYIEQALVEHPGIAAALVELFESRFDPERPVPDEGAVADQVSGIEARLAEVTSLDQDSILRAMLGLVLATLRTNAYRTDEHGTRRQALAVKLDPHRVEGLPAPRPRFEIWVYSPRVEGVHLRFGAVARGGLRWSDRREDFRTEILGLVKAQMVKNVVIVPTGAKGGFVAKRLPDPTVDRDAWLAEGVACYRTFIASLLDLTDNYASEPDGTQRVVPPPQTRRYDAADPYLVVAADKGTATFSDIANSIAGDYGFWLGDAFASGGSVGYDHKVMGITARGAWESVKYHFREMGVDTQSQDFTVAGIGDMSGDVFGNGMLLSRHIRLVAAFDHRHIFLDPDPDAATSFEERRRLFELPRSTWADYDETLISAGGGVYARTRKSIQISPEVARALALPPGTGRMTPTELIHAILVAPVDLLWNGGIGTYVKASTESHQAAGDKANDALRADGNQLRARVVGEGGNLGLTQLGRVEYARAGGRINTDAIDNSAGVDTSDHEVNLKILLDRAVAAGEITRDERNELLQSVTDDVAQLVLRDNYEQNVLLAMARKLSPALASVHQRVIQMLEASGELDRKLEFLPSDKEFAQREQDGLGLVSPENAVLVAYAKITLMRHIEESTLPDEPWFQGVLAELLPRRDRRAVRLVAGQAPAAPGDHQHRGGQRHDQPQRDDVRAPGDRGDRCRRRADHPGVLRGARGVRPAAALGQRPGAGQRRLHRGPARRLPGDPSPGRPGDPLVRRRPLPDHRRRGGGRPVPSHARRAHAAHHLPGARGGTGRHRVGGPAADRPGAAARARHTPGRAAQHVPAARRRRDRQRQPALGRRDRRAALRAVRPVLRRRDADQRHPAAARRPLVDAGARGDAARRLRGAVGHHHRGVALDRRRSVRRAAHGGVDRAQHRARRAGPGHGPGRAGPGTGGPGDAVGGASGDAQPAVLTRPVSGAGRAASSGSAPGPTPAFRSG